MPTLAERVDQEDERRFVGRVTELALLDDLLSGRLPYRVVLVHGAGGIGKSTLLRQLRRRALREGSDVRLIDGRSGVPTSRELEQLLGGLDPARGSLILLDTYERLVQLGRHLRTRVLPTLPAHSVVVIAGRGEPEADWLQGGWERVTVSVDLSPISRGEARELLEREGVADAAAAETLIDWAGGSPLALAVGAEALRHGGSWGSRQLDDHPQVAELLVRRLTEGELGSTHLDVAAVASIARRTDAALLADVLPGVEGEGAAHWLRSRSFAEQLGGGLTLHELVRDALRTSVRRRWPERERELRRRIVDHLYARAAAGEIGLVPDLAELVDNESLRWGMGGEGAAGLRTDEARPEDIVNLIKSGAEALQRGASEWLTATTGLVRDAPRCVLVARDENDRVAGLCIAVTPNNAPAAADRDPVLAPWLAHAREHYADGNMIIWRDSLDLTERHGKRSSRVLAVMNSAAVLRSGLANPRRAFLPIDPANPAAVEFASSVGAKRIDGLDVCLDDRTHECHLLDYGDGGLLAAHRATVYAELGLRPPRAGEELDGGRQLRAPVASAEAVKDALRNIDRPLELARSSLARGDGPRERAESVRRLLAEATESAFGNDPEDQLLRELVRARYLGEPTTHELVAERLHVSRSTYFRHLRAALNRVADYVVEA